MGVGFEALGIGLETLAALDQDRLQRVEVGESAIDDRFVDQRPEPFGRWKLGGGGGQEDQVAALRQTEVAGDMPPGAINDDDGAVGNINALVAGEGRQGQGHGRRVDGGQKTPPAAPGAGANTAVHVAPLVVALDSGQGPLPLRRLDPPQDR